MYPLVLIKSFGKCKSEDIINEIICANGESIEEPMNVCLESYNLKVKNICICTKYFKTQLLLFECEDINSIPDAVKNKIEGVIFYFDSNDSHFLSEVESLVEFVKNNNIGVSIAITRNLDDGCELTYDEVKNKCKLDINVIDLNDSMSDEEPAGYAEVLEILKNHVWSNVLISSRNSKKMNTSDENDVNVEEALNEFEELLNKFQQFKEVSRNLSREEVLQNAENLAELFANMLSED